MYLINPARLALRPNRAASADRGPREQVLHGLDQREHPGAAARPGPGGLFWKGGDQAIIDGRWSTGWKPVGMVSGLVRLADRLSLPLRVLDDRWAWWRVLTSPVWYQMIGEKNKMGLLSLAIWTPILFGVVMPDAMGDDKRDAGAVRWLALLGSLPAWPVDGALCTGFDRFRRCDAVRREASWDPAASMSTTTSAWTASRSVRAADRLHHGHRGAGRLEVIQEPRQPVHGRLPDPVGG